MKNRGKIEALTLFVATIMLFTSTIIPHHHHHGAPCLASTHSTSDCQSANNHNHDANDGCDGGNCIGEESFLSTDRRDAVEQSPLVCLELLPALLCCEHLLCQHVSPDRKIYFEPFVFRDCSPLLPSAHGLRAPPLA